VTKIEIYTYFANMMMDVTVMAVTPESNNLSGEKQVQVSEEDNEGR
jgi:hypothetical protein